MDNFRFSKRFHGGKIYQNYVGKGDETSKGEHLLLSIFNENLTHTPSASLGAKKCRGKA